MTVRAFRPLVYDEAHEAFGGRRGDRDVDFARPLQFTSGNAYYQTAFLERDRYGNAISCARVDLPPGIRSVVRNQCADARTVVAIDSKRVYAQPPLCYIY